jgi:hypothetical protein
MLKLGVRDMRGINKMVNIFRRSWGESRRGIKGNNQSEIKHVSK